MEMMEEPPPRSREEPSEGLPVPVPRRTTPAFAGRTARPWSGSTWRTNHPRVRGKNLPDQLLALALGEPPPRSWEERAP